MSEPFYKYSELPNKKEKSGNPIFSGWYADPEAVVFDNKYWIYPTSSLPFEQQLYMDAFSSEDLVNWEKHPKVLSVENISWLRKALWAPAVIEANGKYYFYFGANDIKNNEEIGGIGVAVADTPIGPFKDVLGKPLIGKIVNGAQPIDQFVFKDDDGQYYMYYGGWGHCNIVKMGTDLISIVPFEDGSMYKEVTPENYVEGPFMLKRNGKYYFMWSEGDWNGPDYSVAYAIADSPFGPFRRMGQILKQDKNIATGAGHHSIIKGLDKDEWYIVYHRHPLGDTDGNHRVTCIDRMYFSQDGSILPVEMTNTGVKAASLR
ncbi:glycoside hydrolase family 43 protein [Bacteroides acidifaciens]|uniref:glycoside hydrolase family 43 protein n=1 Tax=Bacteroides acidifaciens TaxID=85831 RepID=UPI0015D5D0CE|nr:glycoside hydrolase family 43 protein [Bacteroides acidifaciens]MBF0728575.1 family 43 glycosylhydrolase [Bacteroides acidifaciens]MBF0836173.1 family 43 glycosylhydrolase [Bacteroides acidifaciens]